MLRNYLTVIFRSILRNKLFSFIHIFGLAMGLACAFILFMIIRVEYKYDRFHENIDRIYILRKTIFFESGTYTPERTGDAYGPKMSSVFPIIEKASRFRSSGELLFNVILNDGSNMAFLENNGAAVDSSFFEIFTFPMIFGNPQTALSHKYSIVLTESLAEKLFSSTNVLGKEVRINDEFGFLVTGVIKDVPRYSHLQFDFLIPYEFLPELGISLEHYEGTRTQNCFLLHRDADPEVINAVLPELILDWFEPDIESLPFIYPFSKIHLHGESKNFGALLIFFIVGVLILVIASINYTNLSTARFSVRSREVGIRKTIGADRKMLFWQFIGESLFNSFLAMDLALLIVEAFLPLINTYFKTDLSISLNYPSTWISVIVLIFFTGFLAGIYPSLIMSSFQPVNVLKNSVIQGFRKFRLRKLLVTVQFALAVAFILLAVFLIRQFGHIKRMDPGFRKENIVYLPTKGEMWGQYKEFRNELTSLPGVEYITSSSSIPSNIGLGEFEWGSTDESQTSLAMVCWADEGFPELFNIEMLDGEYYQENQINEQETGIVINKRLQDYLQLEEPIGESFYLYHERYRIIGVIDNFEFFPLKLTDQMLIMPYTDVSTYIFISLLPGDHQNTIGEIERIYKELNPAFPFEYYHLADYEMPMDSAFNNSKPFLWFFTILSIFISLLGLFGLTAFTAAQKVKEIGVRKTFGASAAQIIKLFSFQFAKPVIISILAGFVIAYAVMYYILTFFNSQTQLSWWIFALVGLGVLLLAQLTVIGHAIKSSRQQPVDCLRYE